MFDVFKKKKEGEVKLDIPSPPETFEESIYEKEVKLEPTFKRKSFEEVKLPFGKLEEPEEAKEEEVKIIREESKMWKELERMFELILTKIENLSLRLEKIESKVELIEKVILQK